jgi:phosphoribosylformimino-5-aminoimidazole carboxamide ribotide isomerase
MGDATVFSEDPGAMAAHWVKQGARRLHVVDLNGAAAGKPKNESAIKAIVTAVGNQIPIQLGGGIRDAATLQAWLDRGVDRVIIGTAAVRDPALVRDAARKFPGRVAVGLDSRDGKVAVEGWARTSALAALDLARRFEDAGVAVIIHTDIARDGLLQGLNLDATLALATAVTTPVIASGGLASIADVEALLAPRARKLAGAIAGRALYDGRLDAGEALRLIRAARAV